MGPLKIVLGQRLAVRSQRHGFLIVPCTLALNMMAVIGLFSCQKRALSDSETLVGSQGKIDPALSCELRQAVKTLVNPSGANGDNEENFYKFAQTHQRSEGSKLSGLVKHLQNKVNGAGCLPKAKSCFIELVSKSLAKGRKDIDKVKYGHTLKFKDIDGNPAVFVRASGLRPLQDPRQPDGVYERFQNMYTWTFRKAAGDLHPGFIWAALQKKDHPIDLIRSMEGFRCYDSLSWCRDADYKKALRVFSVMVHQQYLMPIYRGGAATGSVHGVENLLNIYRVNPAKISQFSTDPVIVKSIDEIFSSARRDDVLKNLQILLEERRSPALTPNGLGKYEITESVLKKIGITELPVVSADGWSVYFVDHHRISAAYDLGMAIEVLFSRSFFSIN